MIAIMRKFMHSILYKLFLWAFLFSFIFGSIIVVNTSKHKEWVIKAYKETIAPDKFQTMLKLAKQQQDMYRQKGFDFGNVNIKKETLQAGLSGLLAQHAMNQIGMKVAPSFVHNQLQEQLQQLPPYFFKEDGQVDMESFQKVIAPTTIDDLIADIELEIKNKLLFGLVDAIVYVPEFETTLQSNAEFAHKNYTYINLPLQKYLAEAKLHAPSDEILLKFYKKPEISNQFRTVERRAGTVWTFNIENFGLNITEQEAKTFYQKNKMRDYVAVPAQMQIRSLLIKSDQVGDSKAKAEIQDLYQTAQKDPAQFEKLVRQFSQDSSAARGGLSELFDEKNKNLEKIIVETSFESLSSDGQISAPLKVKQGYMLIQRVKKNPTVYQDFKAIESVIKKDLALEKFKKRFAQDASRVVNGAKYNPEMLSKFIERHKGIKVDLPLEEKKAGIESEQLFRIEEGRYVSFFNKDQGMILLCSQIERSKLPAIDQVKSKVQALYFEAQASKMLKNNLEQAFKDASTLSFSEIAQKYGSSVHKASFDYRDGKVEQSNILKESALGHKIKNMQHVGALACAETKSEGILIKLDSIEPVDSKIIKEQKEHLKKTMFYMKMYQIKEGFIASLYRTAKLNNKIEIKPELLQFTKEV